MNKSSGFLHSTPKSFKSIEEFSSFIEQENHKLVESKLRKYSLLDSDNRVLSTFLTPLVTESKMKSTEHPNTLNLNEDLEQETTQKLTAKKSIFSSGGSIKNLDNPFVKKVPFKHIENPFKKENFKKRLNFDLAEQEKVDNSEDEKFQGRKHSNVRNKDSD